MTNTDDNAFALTRTWVNTVVAVLVLVAGLLLYLPFANQHIGEGTFLSVRSLHDMSYVLLAPVITMVVMLFLLRRSLGRFLAYTYGVLVVAEIAAALINDVLFSRFGYLDNELFPTLTVAVPVICIFTGLAAVFVSGESIVRELAKRRRRRPVSI
ncbi:hypothetical protein [Brevibacterium zhoupengii]|uniref:hypothetical protein n=1 Tax=Brevibacterium zhoupengii TaxID=2898795 RepID=UPI001E4ABC7F|nr:hypothetical protein [Brevibacterium zhoupengii]